MARKNIRPVQVLLPPNAKPDTEMLGVYLGIFRTLHAADVYGELEVLSTDRHPVVIEGKAYASYFSFIHEKAAEASDEAGQLNANMILGCLAIESLRPQYTAVVVNEPMYSVRSKTGKKGVGGIALPEVGFVMTLSDLSETDPEAYCDAISFRAGHELAHVWGVLSDDRKTDPQVCADDPEAGLHCLRDCAMLCGPHKRMKVRKKLHGRLFCDACEENLKRYFLK